MRFAVTNDVTYAARNRAALLLKAAIDSEMQGKACMEILTDNVNYKGALVVTALQAGQVEFAAPSFLTLSRFSGGYEVFDLPFAFKDIFAVERFQSRASSQLARALSASGLQSLGFWHEHFRQMAGKKPLFAPGDVAGLKFRNDLSLSFAQQISELNATTQTVDENDLSIALKTGRIDAQISSWDQLQADKTAALGAGVTETNHGFDGYQLIAASDWWQKLKPELRKQISEIILRINRQANFDTATRNSRAKKTIIRRGTAVYTLTAAQRAQWRSQLRPIWDRFVSKGNDDLLAGVRVSDQGL